MIGSDDEKAETPSSQTGESNSQSFVKSEGGLCWIHCSLRIQEQTDPILYPLSLAMTALWTYSNRAVQIQVGLELAECATFG